MKELYENPALKVVQMSIRSIVTASDGLIVSDEGYGEDGDF